MIKADILTISTLKKEDFTLLLHYLKSENNYVEEFFLLCQFELYSQDFFVAYLHKKLVGFVVARRESLEFGTLSSLYVLKEFRRKSFAKQLISHALTHLEQRQVLIESVLGKERLYENFGFKSYLSTTTYRLKLEEILNIKPTLEVNPEEYEEFRCLLKNKSTQLLAIKGNKSAFALSLKESHFYKLSIHSHNQEEIATLLYELCKDFSTQSTLLIEASLLQTPLLSFIQNISATKESTRTKMYNKILN